MASRRLAQLWTPRVGFCYANKGDTRFTAERRVWRLQMKELRRNLQHEELVARREKFLADRDKKSRFDAEQVRAKPSPIAELRKLEIKTRLDLEREESDRARLERRTAAMQREAVKREAESKERLVWLEELQRDYRVDGSTPTRLNLGRKKRVFLTPEVSTRQGSCADACAICARRRNAHVVAPRSAEHRSAAHRHAGV